MEKQTFRTKLHEVCSEDELRPLMMCVNFKNGFAYASDGHMVVKQSLEYHTILGKEFLEGKSVHKDNYKAIMQFEIAECNEEGIACKDSDGRTAFFEWFNPNGAEIPNYESVLKPVGFKSIEFIGINAEFLYKISRALHSPQGALRLQFQGVDKGIYIDTPEIENQYAILMPTVINDSLWNK